MFATTILLRCTVEAENPSLKAVSISKLTLLQDWLQRAWNEFGWDLANFCLERCANPITKLSDPFGRSTNNLSHEGNLTSQVGYDKNDLPMQTLSFTEDSSNSDPDCFIPVDFLNYSWEAWWGPFEDPELSSI